jgi:hypothetical protein
VQVYIDDVPVWGFIGKVEKVDHGVTNVLTQYSYFLFTHFHFEISYNEDRIISIDCAADPQTARDITTPVDQEITFSYSAKWTPTTKKVLRLPSIASRFLTCCAIPRMRNVPVQVNCGELRFR